VHHEPPDETCGELELDVGVDDGCLSFFVPDVLRLDPDEEVEW
jgi:hypothetical protein